MSLPILPLVGKRMYIPGIQTPHIETLAPNNSASYNEMVSCIYPISGQYGLLPRLIYYISLFFAVAARRQRWLVTGALCSAMIFGSTAVIHVFAILFTSGTDPAVFDGDIVPLSVVLLVGAMFPGPVVDFSNTVRESGARPIILLWGLWMMCGTVACMSGMLNLMLGNTYIPTAENQRELPFASNIWPDSSSFRHKSSQIRCLATDALNRTTILESPAQLHDPSLHFNCTYSCFNAKPSPIRGSGEVQIIPFTTLHGGDFSTLFCIGFTALALAMMQTLVQYVRSWIIPTLPSNIIHTTFQMFTQRREGIKFSEIISGWFTTLIRVLNLVLAVPIIVMGEIYILGLGGKQRFPVAEESWTIGQWAAPVGAGFLVLATLFNRYLEKKSAVRDVETGMGETREVPAI